MLIEFQNQIKGLAAVHESSTLNQNTSSASNSNAAVAVTLAIKKIIRGIAIKKQQLRKNKTCNVLQCCGFLVFKVGENFNLYTDPSFPMISYYESDTEYPPASLLPDLVKLLGVTSDELLGIAPLKKSRQPDTRLLRRLQQIEKLDSNKKRQVLQIIDTLIEHAQLTSSTN
jgi:transcriptional regulator with XRE-family HTH domain